MTTKIWIDPGHGGKDPGAIGNGIQEKDIVLQLSREIVRLLTTQYDDIEVKVTRSDDTFVSLEDRTKAANLWRADVFLSLHINAYTKSSAKGFQTYIYPNSTKSTAFQNVMHTEIVNHIKRFNIEDDGKKSANFHVLRQTAMTALLSENLFISNPADASLLKKNEFIKALAQGHVDGLEKFFGLKKKATPTPPQTDTLYQVVAGTFSSRENAEKRVQQLKADKYDSFIQEKE